MAIKSKPFGGATITGSDAARFNAAIATPIHLLWDAAINELKRAAHAVELERKYLEGGGEWCLERWDVLSERVQDAQAALTDVRRATHEADIKTPEGARRLLQRVGILNAEGKLSEAYGGTGSSEPRKRRKRA